MTYKSERLDAWMQEVRWHAREYVRETVERYVDSGRYVDSTVLRGALPRTVTMALRPKNGSV